MALSQTDRDLIRAAVKTYRQAGGEAMALEQVTGLSATRAYQRLNRLLEDPVAWAAEPSALGILRDRRDRRVRSRSLRRAGVRAAG